VQRRAARGAGRARGGAVRGPLSAATLAVALLFVAIGAHAAPPEASRDPTFRAGAARVSLRVPPGTPLGGYGSLHRRSLLPDLLGRHAHAFWFKPHDGVLDDVAARALVMYAGPTPVTW